MLSNYTPVTTMSYEAVSKVSSSGRAYFPVDSQSFLYSHFKYVSGVPREKHQAGVSIGKLQILNTLIDQLIKMKQDAASNRVLPSDIQNEHSLDVMIDFVGTRIHTEVILGKQNAYAPLPPEPAVLFSLSA